MKKLILAIFCMNIMIQMQAQTTSNFKLLDKKTLLPVLFDSPTLNAKGEAKWKPNYGEVMQFSNVVSDDGFCYTAIDTVITYKLLNTEKTIVIFNTIKYNSSMQRMDCHACGVVLSIAEFTNQTNGSWAIDYFYKYFTKGGGWGKRGGSMGIVEIGKNEFALNIKSAIDGGQGYLSGISSYYEINRWDGIKNIFTYTFYNSDEGAMGTMGEVKTSIKFLPSEKGYYNIETTEKSNKKSTTLVSKYKFNDEVDKYLKY